MFYGQCWKCGERWGLGTAPTCKCKGDDDDTMCYRSELEAAVKAEREACAKVCEDFYQGLPPKLTVRGYLEDMAKAIRARGNT